MTEIITADKVKSKFDQVSKIWASMLSEYFDPDGQLRPECVYETPCPNRGAAEYDDEFVISGFQYKTCQEMSRRYLYKSQVKITPIF